MVKEYVKLMKANQYLTKMTKTWIIICLCLVSFFSCKPQDDMKKYEWRPTACAPKYYPAEVIKGDFYMDDGTSIYIPTGHTLMHGWGDTGAIHLSGPDFKQVPSSFSIKWVSYLEGKFYGGNFQLPKEKITDYFEKGFVDRRGIQRTYTKTVIGLAPGGVLVVWLLGPGKVVEIERYQAKEIEVHIEDFKPYSATTLSNYLTSARNRIVNDDIRGAIDVDNIPFGIWDIYRKKYEWNPTIDFKNQSNVELTNVYFSYYNGEMFRTIGSNKKAMVKEQRAIPKESGITWTDGNGNEFGATITFDDKEMLRLFHEVYLEDKNTSMEIIIQLDKYNSIITSYIKTETKTYPITKTVSEISVYTTE
ncbi:DUF2931 family protein [Cellulophaga baltica]|nr:DUF2931 family protein [Cellulophaga baltica]